MGLFSFFKDAGKSVLGNGNDDEAIKNEIEESLGAEAIDGLVVSVEDGKVTLAGVAQDNATREKAILIAGNIEGVEAVDADQLVTPEMIAAASTPEEGVEESAEAEVAPTTPIPEPRFYTIQEGDSLWKIAQEFYGDGNKYTYLVQENIEVIKDENKIYPGQTIRIPEIDVA
ncbi:MAG: peptidoglycan-binding protein LysM [Epsilonproteobacteria bacterium]|nr:peptidoglycan-binding protein LysM [Campylobacterota bacterium]